MGCNPMRILVFWSLAMLTCSAFLFFLIFSSSTWHFHWILSGKTLGMDGISMAHWVAFTRFLIWKVFHLTYSLAIQCHWVFYTIFAGASGARWLVFPFLNPLPTESRLYLYLFVSYVFWQLEIAALSAAQSKIYDKFYVYHISSFKVPW